MAIIREHLAHKGLGLHNDLQNESSIVGNFPTVHHDAATSAPRRRRRSWIRASSTASAGSPSASPSRTTAPTRPASRPRAAPDGDEWVINGAQAVQLRPAPRHARHRVRAHLGRAGSAAGHHRVPRADRRAGLQRRLLLVDVQHADRPRRGRRCATCACPRDAVFGEVDHGLELAQTLRAREPDPPGGRRRSARRSTASTTPSRTRPARMTWGKPLSRNQAIQFPLVELHTEAAMVRQLVATPRGSWTASTTWRSRTWWRCATTAPTGWRATPPTGRCRPAAARLQPAHAVRAHLPSPPPLPHHRGLRGDPDAPSGPALVQVRLEVTDTGQLSRALARVATAALGTEAADRQPARADRRGQPHHVGVRRA